jgi:hypothetical protein
MMDRKPRRFGMGDMMIVVVAVALGAARTRAEWPGAVELYLHLVEGPWYVSYICRETSKFLSIWLLPFTAGFVVVRLRKPRPRRARLVLQPGMAAACAVATPCAYSFVLTLFHVAVSLPNFKDRVGFSELLNLVLAVLPYSCGICVAAVWLVLWLAGRWRAERSGIDRLGRVLGAFWIVASALIFLSR